MKLVIEKEAVKRFAKIQPALRAALINELTMIAAAPFAHHSNVKPLKGEKDLFRLRHGDWRVIFRVVWIDDEIRVLVLDTRGGIYK